MKNEELLRRFRNAQRRCKYWSGLPSFNVGARAKAQMSGRMDEKYELYMCDQKSLAGLLKDRGITVRVRDYKSEFAANFVRLMNQQKGQA